MWENITSLGSSLRAVALFKKDTALFVVAIGITPSAFLVRSLGIVLSRRLDLGLGRDRLLLPPVDVISHIRWDCLFVQLFQDFPKFLLQ